MQSNCKCQSLTGMLSSCRMASLPGCIWLISTFCRSSIAAGNGHCQHCENQHSLHECVYIASAHSSIILCNPRVQCRKHSQCRCVLYIDNTLLKWVCFPYKSAKIIILYKYARTCKCNNNWVAVVSHLTFRQLQSVMILINANLWIVM